MCSHMVNTASTDGCEHIREEERSVSLPYRRPRRLAGQRRTFQVAQACWSHSLKPDIDCLDDRVLRRTQKEVVCSVIVDEQDAKSWSAHGSTEMMTGDDAVGEIVAEGKRLRCIVSRTRSTSMSAPRMPFYIAKGQGVPRPRIYGMHLCRPAAQTHAGSPEVASVTVVSGSARWPSHEVTHAAMVL